MGDSGVAVFAGVATNGRRSVTGAATSTGGAGSRGKDAPPWGGPALRAITLARFARACARKRAKKPCWFGDWLSDSLTLYIMERPGGKSAFLSASTKTAAEDLNQLQNDD